MSFEIQTNTICDGWVNLWTEHHDDGTSRLVMFDTYDEAKAELDELIKDMQDSVELGYVEDFDVSEYRIVETGASQ